jgi:hypothetical protein
MLIRLRNCNIHNIFFTYDEYLNNYRQKLTREEISKFRGQITEKDFFQFRKDSLRAVDIYLTYFYANLFGVLNVNNPMGIQDSSYLSIKEYFVKGKIPTKIECKVEFYKKSE